MIRLWSCSEEGVCIFLIMHKVSFERAEIYGSDRYSLSPYEMRATTHNVERNLGYFA